MPLIKSCKKENISKNIAELIRSGRKADQASAIAYSVCEQLKKKKRK